MRQTFKVPEVSCGHCKGAIEGALQPLEGVAGADVDLDSKTVAVDYDEAVVSEASLRERIEEAGYSVPA